MITIIYKKTKIHHILLQSSCFLCYLLIKVFIEYAGGVLASRSGLQSSTTAAPTEVRTPSSFAAYLLVALFCHGGNKRRVSVHVLSPIPPFPLTRHIRTNYYILMSPP